MLWDGQKWIIILRFTNTEKIFKNLFIFRLVRSLSLIHIFCVEDICLMCLLREVLCQLCCQVQSQPDTNTYLCRWELWVFLDFFSIAIRLLSVTILLKHEIVWHYQSRACLLYTSSMFVSSNWSSLFIFALFLMYLQHLF